MLVWAKLFAGFSGLGAISVIPLTLANKEPVINFKFAGRGGQEMSQTLTKILEEKGEEGYKGCVALQGGERYGRISSLYVCINTKESNKSFLFYYDISKKNPAERVNAVTHIDHKYSWEAIVYLNNGERKTLRTPPIWMGKWKSGNPFKPAEHCKLSKKNAANYTLICSLNKGTSSTPELIQEIS